MRQHLNRYRAYPTDYFLVMRDAILFRYSLIPHIYTESHNTYETGVSLCRPMYYEYPEAAEAYEFKGQYLFGDKMMVAPIATPIDSTSMLATQRVWIPPGD